MTDDTGIVLILFQKFLGAREGQLIQVFLYLFLRHADTAVADSKRTLFFIYSDVDGKVLHGADLLAPGRQCLELCRCIHGVGDQFAQKYFLVRIQKLLNDRKDIFRLY
jgi:hypothetical protein